MHRRELHRRLIGNVLLLTFLTVFSTSSQASERRLNPQTGLWIWTNADEHFSLELVALHGEYVSAVFGGKGFTPAMLDQLAGYCFYGTIVRNTSGRPLHMRVRDWFARTPEGQEQPLKTKTEWLQDWSKAGVPFKWLMLADDVVFAADDWLQGYSSVRLPRGARFALHYSWILEGQRHDAVIPDVECPPMVLPTQ